MLLFALPAGIFAPNAVTRLLTLCLAYLITRGDDHGLHILHTLIDLQVKRPAATLSPISLVGFGVTPFGYWVGQGVATYLVAVSCPHISV